MFGRSETSQTIVKYEVDNAAEAVDKRGAKMFRVRWRFCL
jgi:hypothetical protein